MPSSVTVKPYNQVWMCRTYDRVYWSGSHLRRLQSVVANALNAQSHSRRNGLRAP
ncbi:MAG: Mut7-C RNAse domain-containing protein [Gammaproteobacteria bacterium]